jgi:acyl-coenzyme A synthetase/AMP-(fatty) acid ligase
MLVRQANLWRARLPADTWQATRALYCTGADLDPREVATFHDATGVPVLNYYGLTETVGLCLSQSLQDWQPDDTSLGGPVGCEVRLVDEAGQPVPAGTPGELQVRQRWPSQGYWGAQDASADLFDPQGWLRTGDLAEQDAQGRVRLVGRQAHFIKTAGTEKVAPAEVEQALQTHPAVLEAAVLGVPAGAGVERIAALVVLRPEVHHATATPLALQTALIQQVTDLLGAARAPSRLRFVNHLPRAANGKLLRPLLPDLWNAP